MDTEQNRIIAHQFILNLPLTNTIAPIAVSTLYLWVIDTVALRKGTWVIQSSTKLGWHLWDGLEIEYLAPPSLGYIC